MPPYLYARQLMKQLQVYVGAEYHWFLHQRFLSKLNHTYKEPANPCVRRRIWLCQLLTVFALGASYSRYDTTRVHVLGDEQSPNVDHSQVSIVEEAGSTLLPPGAEFFDQATTLFKLPTEEASIEHMEGLNLMVRTHRSVSSRTPCRTLQ